MEKTNVIVEMKNRGVTNFGLAGRLLTIDGNRVPLKSGHVYTAEDMWKYEIEEMLRNPQTKEDFDAIGLKLNYAIDNYKIDIWDYQMQAAKKRAEIYNKSKSEVKVA